MINKTIGHESEFEVKDKHLTVGKKEWQAPQLNEVDFSVTNFQDGSANDGGMVGES